MGAHPDGSPLGTPANRPLKDARIAAHASFDRLWKDGGSRGRAYRFLQSALNLSEDTCHIGMFDLATCARVVEVCDREMGRRSGIHGKPAQRKRVRQ